jgi:hypothetical protein
MGQAVRSSRGPGANAYGQDFSGGVRLAASNINVIGCGGLPCKTPAACYGDRFPNENDFVVD